MFFHVFLVSSFSPHFFISCEINLDICIRQNNTCDVTSVNDAVICVGAVIRGSTSHYDYVCAEVSKGIASVSLETGVPVMFGVLTTDTIEQAIERAGTKAGNKGSDAAKSAIEMVNLLANI